MKRTLLFALLSLISVLALAVLDTTRSYAQERVEPGENSPERLQCWRQCYYHSFRNQRFNCLSGRPDAAVTSACEPECGKLSSEKLAEVCQVR